jgi:hypothetical protein
VIGVGVSLILLRLLSIDEYCTTLYCSTIFSQKYGSGTGTLVLEYSRVQCMCSILFVVPVQSFQVLPGPGMHPGFGFPELPGRAMY